jgi:hypothetical protein
MTKSTHSVQMPFPFFQTFLLQHWLNLWVWNVWIRGTSPILVLLLWPKIMVWYPISHGQGHCPGAFLLFSSSSAVCSYLEVSSTYTDFCVFCMWKSHFPSTIYWRSPFPIVSTWLHLSKIDSVWISGLSVLYHCLGYVVFLAVPYCFWLL